MTIRQDADNWWSVIYKGYVVADFATRAGAENYCRRLGWIIARHEQ